VSAPSDAHTLPFAWYSDEETLRRERASIFARSWQYGGRAGQVDEPGSYLTTDAGGVPLLVTRTAEGELHAFLNVCRHRGAILTEGCGRRETIQCHYHAWTYGLDGSLRAAPRSDREAGFEQEELSLVPASVGVWGPFLFVNPDPEAEPLADWLGDLPEILARDLDLDSVSFHSRVEFSSNANWKVVTENFLECYHCPTAHPGFSAVVDVHPDRYVLEPHPTFSSQHCEARSGGERGQFHLLYPNTGINVFPGPANLSIGPIVPTAPGRTERYLDYFFAADANEGWLADFFAFDDQVGREDTALVESVQRGMDSGMLDHGRLLLDAEPLLAAFQGWVRSALQRDV
jgi:choline monooxygenase